MGHQAMKGFPLTGCLLAATGLMLLALVLVSVFPEVVDGSPLLSAVMAPLLVFLPWAPMLLFGWLFARLGSDQRPARWGARVLSGVSLSLACLFLSFVFAGAGRLVVPVEEDAMLLGGLLVTALALGVFGFWPARAGSE